MAANTRRDYSRRAKRKRATIQFTGYWDIGDPIYECKYCGAMMWIEERAVKRTKVAEFSLCCQKGKIELPLLKDPPQLLHNLLTSNDDKSQNFIENIRSYNMMFSFTSLGGKFSHIKTGRGPYVFRLHGQNCHLIGSLLPEQGFPPKFCQLYIYDTEHEASNRVLAYDPKGKKKT